MVFLPPRWALGCAPIGGLFAPVPQDAATQTVEAALTAGITLFDTAPHYGAGLSERALGCALAGRDRDSFRIATKVGRRIVDGSGDAVAPGACGARTVGDLSRDGVLRSLESSLLRLGVDRVDLLYLHDPVNVDDALENAWPALQSLRAEGTVGAIGVGMNYSESLARFALEADPDVLMVAGRLTLLDRSALDQLMPPARDTGVGIVAAGVFNSGVLADPHDGAHFDYQPASEQILERAQAMDRACVRHGVRLVDAAVHFPLRFPEVSTVVVGARSPDEVFSFAASASVSISDELWGELDDI